MDDRYLYAGLIRLHLLHHAVKEPIYGLAMIEELGRHGYKLSAGTLYPILHGLEEKGYLILDRGADGECGAPAISRDANGRAGTGGGQSQGARIIRRTVRGRRR
jgi:PadR family transcriptional regulator PadR